MAVKYDAARGARGWTVTVSAVDEVDGNAAILSVDNTVTKTRLISGLAAIENRLKEALQVSGGAGLAPDAFADGSKFADRSAFADQSITGT